jgi:beta-lactamase regulating signal transducer with metallopeptidase domain
MTQVIAVVWLAGVAIFLVPVGAGLWQMHRLRGWALPWMEGQELQRPIASARGVRRRVDVLRHEAVTGPITCALFTPAIVFPADAASWDAAAIRRSLTHELEHVARYDWLTLCLSRIVCAVYWFHPLVWMVWRRLRLEAERACDDAVLLGDDAREYASLLVTMAQREPAAQRAPLLAMAARSDLSARVAAVLDGRQERGRPGRAPAFGLIAVSAAAVLTVAPISIAARVSPTREQAVDSPTFEVASIKANTLADIGSTVSSSSRQAPQLPSSPLPNAWQISSSAHFDVTYLPSLADRVDSITAAAERAYQKVSADLQHQLSIRPLLVLFSTRVDLEQAVTSGNVVVTSGNVPGNRKHILVPLDMPPGQVGGQLAHELGHVFTFDIAPSSAGNDFPRWIHEGLAEFARGEWADTDLAVLRERVRTQTLPTLLRSPAAATGDARLVRILGHAAIDFLVSRAGRGQVRQLLLLLRDNGADPVGGYLTRLGLPATEFERGFREYLNERFVSPG